MKRVYNTCLVVILCFLGGTTFDASEPFTYSTFGLGYGWGLKGLKGDLPLSQILTHMPSLSSTIKLWY
jgi:hypothetical protein